LSGDKWDNAKLGLALFPPGPCQRCMITSKITAKKHISLSTEKMEFSTSRKLVYMVSPCQSGAVVSYEDAHLPSEPRASWSCECIRRRDRSQVEGPCSGHYSPGQISTPPRERCLPVGVPTRRTYAVAATPRSPILRIGAVRRTRTPSKTRTRPDYASRSLCSFHSVNTAAETLTWTLCTPRVRRTSGYARRGCLASPVCLKWRRFIDAG
jgi:hypothetical protein